MNRTSLIAPIISFVFLNGCNQYKERKVNLSENIKGTYETISVKIDDRKTLFLSEIYENTELITLETLSNNLIGEINKMEVKDGKYYINSEDSIFIFDNNGHFEREINNQGSGIGEYMFLSDFILENANQNEVNILIYDSKSKKIIRYNHQGDYIDEIITNLDAYSFCKLGNNNYAVYIGSAYYNEGTNSMLNILDTNGKIVNTFIPIDEKQASYFHFADLRNFQSHNDSKTFLYSFNDTIYSFGTDFLTPRYYVDFNEHKLPQEYLEKSYGDVMEFLEPLKKTEYAFRIIGFFETDNIIVFSFMHKQDVVHVYYSKETKNCIVANKLINDFLYSEITLASSYSNLPKSSDSTKLYSIISAFDYVSNIDELKSKLSDFQWSEFEKKHPNLIEKYNHIEINDNPIILVGITKSF